jgi:hypothetical protein
MLKSNFTKIRLMGAELFHANRRTDVLTDVTKPIVHKVFHRTFSEFQIIVN